MTTKGATAKSLRKCEDSCLDGAEFEGGVVEIELEAEGLDDQLVVEALGQAGDGDAAEDAGAGDDEWEGAAVDGLVGLGEGVLFGDGSAGF
jgi:hypothetical protein